MVLRGQKLMVMLIKREDAQLQGEAPQPCWTTLQPPGLHLVLQPRNSQTSIYFPFLPPLCPWFPIFPPPKFCPTAHWDRGRESLPGSGGYTFGPVFSMKPCLR